MTNISYKNNEIAKKNLYLDANPRPHQNAELTETGFRNTAADTRISSPTVLWLNTDTAYLRSFKIADYGFVGHVNVDLSEIEAIVTRFAIGLSGQSINMSIIFNRLPNMNHLEFDIIKNNPLEIGGYEVANIVITV